MVRRRDRRGEGDHEHDDDPVPEGGNGVPPPGGIPGGAPLPAGHAGRPLRFPSGGAMGTGARAHRPGGGCDDGHLRDRLPHPPPGRRGAPPQRGGGRRPLLARRPRAAPPSLWGPPAAPPPAMAVGFAPGFPAPLLWAWAAAQFAGIVLGVVNLWW